MSSNKRFESTEEGKRQETLFEKDDYEWWKQHWKNMPEFHMEDIRSEQSVIVHFETKKDRDDFARLLNQKITSSTKSIWYPKIKIERFMNKRYIDEEE